MVQVSMKVNNQLYKSKQTNISQGSYEIVKFFWTPNTKGDYTIKIEVNPIIGGGRKFAELNYEDNTASVSIPIQTEEDKDEDRTFLESWKFYYYYLIGAFLLLLLVVYAFVSRYKAFRALMPAEEEGGEFLAEKEEKEDEEKEETEDEQGEEEGEKDDIEKKPEEPEEETGREDETMLPGIIPLGGAVSKESEEAGAEEPAGKLTKEEKARQKEEKKQAKEVEKLRKKEEKERQKEEKRREKEEKKGKEEKKDTPEGKWRCSKCEHLVDEGDTHCSFCGAEKGS